ncbi:hypothetical protein ZYGR_0AF02540 [Zygosaccharomyces rouxii]|uniref:Peptidase S26 domain-containing protein n=1 Tax=Zygosaccharomyces rouxii TaxID=4956 RepID=A0A1Q3A8A2_ZYGRO|nr:hypothetical protein ZYGR_0AF02540 [Zygosaccharomyces rouxii]
MSSTIQAWLKTGSYAIRAVCFVHIIHTYVYEFTETRGESMLPTLAASNDYVHAFKKYKDGKNCKMGDCIVAVKPSDPDHRVCKRITGMPGDVILVDPSMGTQLDRVMWMKLTRKRALKLILRCQRVTFGLPETIFHIL